MTDARLLADDARRLLEELDRDVPGAAQSQLRVALVGAPHLGNVDLLAVHDGVPGLLGGAALVFFAYEGFEEVATLDGPARAVVAATFGSVRLIDTLAVGAARTPA